MEDTISNIKIYSMKVFIVIGAAILASVGFLGPVIDIIMLNHLAKDK